MVSKGISILILALALFFAFSSLSMGLQQTSISISSTGTISFERGYICGNYNSTHYYAQNNATSQYELISADASQTISYALSKLTPGRTWRETVLLKGNFSIYTTITLSVGNVLLDCSQATLNLAANTILLNVRPGSPTQLNDIIVGGHWKGRAAESNNAIQFMYALNCTLKNANIEGFSLLYGAVALAFESGGITVQNCWIHDNGAGYPCVNIRNSGHNRIINCKFSNSGMGVMVNTGTPANQILGCEFYGWASNGGSQQHGIYLDGQALSTEGNNIVSGCIFHDPHDGAGIIIKCQNNSISNSVFYNFPAAAVGFSIYSQYSPCTANDNRIFNNSFSNMNRGLWLGQTIASSPTLRNQIYDNTFNLVTNCISFLGNSAANWVNDTVIEHNNFSNCTNAVLRSSDVSGTLYAGKTIIENNTFKTVSRVWDGKGVDFLIRWNNGYKTEFSGSALNTTATTFTFTHGLVSTPVRVNASFNATGFSWSWTATSSTITITLSSRPNAKAITCHCEAYTWNYP